MNRGRSLRASLFLVALLGPAAFLSQDPLAPRPSRLTLSRETTYFLEPLRPDGTIDYVAALNAIHNDAAAPENNAAAVLLEAFGPRVLLDERPDAAEVLKRIGAPLLPAAGDYFMSRDVYVQRLAKPPEAKAAAAPATGADLLLDVIQARRAPWAEREHPMTAGWLRANEGPLSRIVEATKRPRFWIPLRSGELARQTRYLVEARDAANALCARAALELGSGDVAGARADLLAAHRFGILVAEIPTVTEWLLGIGIQLLAHEGTAMLATRAPLTAAEARSALSELDALPPFPDAIALLDRVERAETLDLLSGLLARSTRQDWEMLELGHLPAAALDWDEVLRTANAGFDRFLAAARTAEPAARRAALESWRGEAEAAKAQAEANLRPAGVKALQALEGNAGRIALSQALAVNFMPDSMRRILLNVDQADAYLQLDRVALALAGYRAETKSFPAGLGVLVPRYLKELPRDPFSGQAPIYERRGAGYLLYSVGFDGKPDRGAGAKSGDDIVLRVE